MRFARAHSIAAMSQHRSRRAYHLTLFRQGAPAHEAARTVVQASPMPVAAPSEWRVSATVREVVARLEEEFSPVDSIEVLCRFAGDDPPAAQTPGLVLLDRRFPLWLAIFEDSVFMSIDTELLDGNPRERFRTAQKYIEALRTAGYAEVFDHQHGRYEETSLSELTARLAAAGHSRWFNRLKLDARFGFAFNSVGFAVASAVLDLSFHSARPLWTYAAAGLWFGAFAAGAQYWAARRKLTGRLQQIRDEIIHGPSSEDNVEFRKSASALGIELAAILVFGGFATIGVVSGSWLIGAFIGSFCAAAIISVVIGLRRSLALDSHAIEARAPILRSRIDYDKVLQITHWPTFDATIVSSERDRIIIPTGFDARGALVSALWDRVVGALIQPASQPPPSDIDLLQQLRGSLGAARRSGFELRDFAWPPLWMLVRRWRHPLRPQYPRQRRLLREGRLVLARVVTANAILRRIPRDEVRFDAPAIVMFALDSSAGPVCLDQLDRIAGRLNDGSDPDAADSFWKAVDASREFPLLLPIPEPFAEGLQVYCTSVMIARRHIPLGYLRAGWLPLLVAPPERYAMVLPMRFWGPAVRSAWKRGEEATPAQTYAA